MNRIVVVGSINADLTVQVARHPHPGETLLGTGGDVSAGGKGANQALAAALNGADVAMVGAIGRDPYAAPATAYLKDAGVNLDAVAEVEGATGLAVITVAADGENTIIVVPGANATVTADYVDLHADSLSDAAIVLLQGEIPADGFRRAVELAREAGTRVVINLAPVVEVDRGALLTADPLLANEHEAGLILQQLGRDCSGTPEELAGRLIDAGFASVVLTLGGKGAIVAKEGSELEQVPAIKCSPIDTTGAGDAFAGALCARLAAGADLGDAACVAAEFAGRTTERRGAQASYLG